ncbi:hypothetical protein N7462_008473 [Penicillium macrosclerotiorum]|uniref:uncharacterized protein n=1 Tax=Penicillium macrosclerotiorum TaxID=303699 RepID=UPI0025479F8D|nr:uncharacterized protein N7462_008473 [Penicillium macrosclerotiorum]KAJ5675576.1 hypothetical protein N7462_008473 [Penicillium macrosclerotiorum]
MRILLHPQLRAALPKSAQRNLCSRINFRFKSQASRVTQRHESVVPTSKNAGPTARNPSTASVAAKTSIRRGPPERILVYYGGTGRSMFLGILRVTTILLFGGACLIVAPSCYSDESPWYITPLVIAGGALPMLFVAYTCAPYVNFVHLALPAFARKSRENALHYARDLPPTSVLYLTTMRFNTIPRQTVVRLGDLVPDKHAIRPVTFRNLKPTPRPWWIGRAPTQFYASDHSQPGRRAAAFYPELWPAIYKRIQSQTAQKF